MPDDNQTIITPVEALIRDNKPLDARGYLTNEEGAREVAGKELMALLRGEGPENLQISVTCRNGIYAVMVIDLSSGAVAIGDGRTFSEAWHKRAKPGATDTEPGDAGGPVLTLVPNKR